MNRSLIGIAAEITSLRDDCLQHRDCTKNIHIVGRGLRSLRLLKLPSFFKQALFPLRGSLALLALVLLSQAIVIVLLPLPVKFALDRLTDVTFVFQMSGFLLLLMVTILALDAAEEILQARHLQKLNLNLRSRYVSDLLTRTYAFHLKQKRMDVVGQISPDVSNLEIFLTGLVVVTVRSIPSMIFIFVALWMIHPGVTIALAAALPIFYLLVRGLSRRLKQGEREFRRQTQRFEDLILQILQALPLIKSLAAEDHMKSQVIKQHGLLNEALWRVRMRTLGMNSLFTTTRLGTRAALLLAGAVAITSGYFTLGSLFALATYIDLLQKPVFEFASFFTRFPKAMASLERLQEGWGEMDLHPEPSGQEQFPPQCSTKPLLHFRKVSVRFPSGDHSIEPLKDFTFKLHAGEAAVIVGPSGVGKSTLLKTINRLVPVTSGEIEVCGVKALEIDIHQLRRRLRVVLQESLMLPASIRENLIIGASTPVSENELWWALRQVNAEDFVRALPGALDCRIGEGGSPLSGGQYRRLSLARAFLDLQQADLIGFDEPTSGLDPESADHVIRSIVELKSCGKAVLWTTHRWSEAASANHIVRLTGESRSLLSEASP